MSHQTWHHAMKKQDFKRTEQQSFQAANNRGSMF